jgi:lipopolysaccharide transport system ATP-binding protein
MGYDPQLLMRVRNVGVSFWQRAGFLRGARFWAVNDIGFDLYKGETFGIIGRNAAGKSTLLQALAGIISPDRGAIETFASSASLLSLSAGFVPYLSGRENAFLNGLMLGMPREKVRSNLENVKRFSELGDFFEQPVMTYSSGMKARLGFSAAMYFDPEILLIDEMLGVGDADFKKKSGAAMREKIKSNLTVILVSHSPSTIRNLCERAMWMEEGKTIAVGPVGQIMDDYEAFMEEFGRADDPEKRHALRRNLLSRAAEPA